MRKLRPTCSVMAIALFSAVALAQDPVLEFRYEFDTTEAPLVDSTGNYGNMGLGANGGLSHRFGEESLVGGDGYSLGLDAPASDHPTGTYGVVVDAPHSDSFSYSMWIRPLLTGTTEALFGRDTVWWPSPCNYYCLYIDSQQSLVYKTDAQEQILTDEGLIEDGELYHVVLTHLDSDGPDTGAADRARLYLNGELVGDIDEPSEIPSLESIADANDIYTVVWLGTLSSFGGYYGEIDDFQYYTGELSAEQVAELYNNPGTAIGGGGVPGDYDGDGVLTAADINILTDAVLMMDSQSRYDLDGNGDVDAADRVYWVNTLKNTFFGDSNLDGEFNSSDFVVVFQAGRYEDSVAGNGTWETGDWNGDAEFDSSDFVIAFQEGGYEMGPKAAVASVPEPSTLGLILVGCLGLFGLRRR